MSDHWRPYLDWAERRGLWLFPVYAHSKLPANKWKTEASPDRADWEGWIAEGYQLGINAFKSGKILLDLDIDHVGRDLALEVFSKFLTEMGSEWISPYCQSPKGGYHFMVDRPAGYDPEQMQGLWKPRMTSHARPLADGEKDAELISVRNRGYCVAPGSQFGKGSYLLTHAADLRHECPIALLEKLKLPEVTHQATGEAGQSDPNDLAAVVAALDALDYFDDEEKWKFNGIGAIKLALGDTEEGQTVAMQITWADVSYEEFLYQWNRMDAVEKPGKNYRRVGTLIRDAEKLTGKRFHVRKAIDWSPALANLSASPSIAPDLPPLPYGEGAPSNKPAPTGMSLIGGGNSVPPDSEDSLALSFADLHADDLRYCEEWGRWMHWTGQAWSPDKTSSAYDMVRKHLRTFTAGRLWPEARKIATAKTVAAVERMARTDRRIVTTGDVWDGDPWLLNTPGGVVDLQTGQISPAAPGFHMTKTTDVVPGGDCPTWTAFLDKSLGGDKELIAFVQRMLGYALTGDTREHALFFLYGQGGNGKGVLLNTVAGIMGDYQKTAPVETFIDSPHERHPTDLAGLRGARLVTASETEKGRRWAEAKIKMLTGGDRIAARFMRQDFFEFVPQFKLVIAGNHKPSLRSVDEAIRRRMHLVPFTVNIPESERDTGLSERLKAEWGGILQWLVEGCLAWQRTGLQAPATVRAATDEYLTSEDVLQSWLDERCDQAAGHWASRQELFMSWQRWAEQAREFVGTQKQFLDAMRQHGFEEGKDKTGKHRGFRGIQLKPPEKPDPSMPPMPPGY
jgi:putative DNA primase/helicase